MGNSLCLCRALSIYEFKSDRLLAVCVVLDGKLGLAEDGYFDDDETVLNAILAKDQADD